MDLICYPVYLPPLSFLCPSPILILSETGLNHLDCAFLSIQGLPSSWYPTVTHPNLLHILLGSLSLPSPPLYLFLSLPPPLSLFIFSLSLSLSLSPSPLSLCMCVYVCVCV